MIQFVSKIVLLTVSQFNTTRFVTNFYIICSKLHIIAVIQTEGKYTVRFETSPEKRKQVYDVVACNGNSNK